MLGKNYSQAYVVLHCEKGAEFPTLKNLCKISEVKEADVVFGFYDVVCRIESSNENVLQYRINLVFDELLLFQLFFLMTLLLFFLHLNYNSSLCMLLTLLFFPFVNFNLNKHPTFYTNLA